MTSERTYYHAIITIPSDIGTELPGIDERFVEWITGKEWSLPETADWDLTQVEQAQVTLADKITRDFIRLWEEITKNKDLKYFSQLENGEERTHIHLLFEQSNVKSMILGRYVNKIEKHIIQNIYKGHVPEIENWFKITKTKPNGGANKTQTESFIPAYLLPKVQPDVQWAWTNLKDYKIACLNAAERSRIAEEHLRQKLGVVVSKSSGSYLTADKSAGPVIKTKASERFMELVDWFVETGIVNDKLWLQANRESFLSFHATSQGTHQAKQAMEKAKYMIKLTKTAADYLILASEKSIDEDQIKNNRIYKIMELNNYDPLYVANIFVGWCKRSFGKRNTLWFFGRATTGKTNIAEAIAHAVPFYGCVNWTNENFPFNDCTDKMVIWWEEGKMTAKIVETAKAILGGSKVRVDQKCKQSVAIEPTPVLITSNTDMCFVIDGNTTSFEHKEPLQDRMFRLELNTRLPDDFGKVTKQEVIEFFKWGDVNPVPVKAEFHVPKRANQKRPRSPDPGEGSSINTGDKRVCAQSPERPPPVETSFPSESEKIKDYSEKYVNRCTRHLGWAVMEFPCKTCEMYNRVQEVCMPHQTFKCIECFPPYASEGDTLGRDSPNNVGASFQNESDKTKKPCAIHHLLGKYVETCPACQLKNVTLGRDSPNREVEHVDDCDNEQ